MNDDGYYSFITTWIGQVFAGGTWYDNIVYHSCGNSPYLRVSHNAFNVDPGGIFDYNYVNYDSCGRSSPHLDYINDYYHYAHHVTSDGEVGYVDGRNGNVEYSYGLSGIQFWKY